VTEDLNRLEAQGSRGGGFTPVSAIHVDDVRGSDSCDEENRA